MYFSSAKVGFLVHFNVRKLGMTGFEYVELTTYVVGLKSIVVMHSCPTAYVIMQAL